MHAESRTSGETKELTLQARFKKTEVSAKLTDFKLHNALHISQRTGNQGVNSCLKPELGETQK